MRVTNRARIATACFPITLFLSAAFAQTPPTTAPQPPSRPTFPIRDARTPGYVSATQLPDGAVPAPTADGNFIIGPTHNPAPGMDAPDLTNG